MPRETDKINKTVLIADYLCNNKCRFCIDESKRSMPAKSTRQLFNEMESARLSGSHYLELIGGELSIRPDIFLLIKHAKKLHFKTVTMATNGRMFSYKDFARRIAGSGIDWIIFSIHSNSAKWHDYLTRAKGSFEQLMAGLNNLNKLGFKNIGSNTVITKPTLTYLPQTGKMLYELGIRNAEFIFIDPTQGGGKTHFKHLVPRLSVAARYIKKCLRTGQKRGISHWHVRYVPLCLFAGYEEQISELHERKYFRTVHIGPDFKNFDVEGARMSIGRTKPEKCLSCARYAVCEGLWIKYYKEFGDNELKPIKPEVIIRQ